MADWAAVVAKAKPKVVRIEAGDGFGTGVVVESLHLITNAHVVGRLSAVRITSCDACEFIGSVRWRSRKYDLAIVHVADLNIEPLPMGRSCDLREGDEVVALGHPLGLDFTITRGIISAKDRKYGELTYIQTDTAINPGNSGGPLIDSSGAVVGINTFMLTRATGLNFAIPIDRVMDVLQTFLDSKTASDLFHCHTCEQPFNSSDIYCPTCGTPIGITRAMANSHSGNKVKQSIHSAVSGTEVESCKACGNQRDSLSPYCGVCGSRFGRET